MQLAFPAHGKEGPIPYEHGLASAAGTWAAAATVSGLPARGFWELLAEGIGQEGQETGSP